MKKTKIEWCDSTWNPVTGCLHGCEYCYARAMAKRFPAVYPNGFEPMFYKDRLNQFDNCKGRNIFVCSMGDLFGDFIPDEWIEKVLDKCAQNQQHNYLFLTKNPFRYEKLHISGQFPKLSNVWYGFSMTDNSCEQCWVDNQYNTFISVEPLLENLNQNMMKYLDITNWVIIGAETGRRKNKVIPKKEWIDKIVKHCHGSNVPVFMKNSLIPIIGEENMLREFPTRLQRKERNDGNNACC